MGGGEGERGEGPGYFRLARGGRGTISLFIKKFRSNAKLGNYC